MNSVKIDLKLFLQEPVEVELEDFIPIFHNWIQHQRLDDLPIDVVDRRETHPSRNAIQGMTERLQSVVQCALAACQLLEAEPSLQGRVRFRGDEILLRINDRLVSPTPAAFDDLQAHLQPVLATPLPGLSGGGGALRRVGFPFGGGDTGFRGCRCGDALQPP